MASTQSVGRRLDVVPVLVKIGCVAWEHFGDFMPLTFFSLKVGLTEVSLLGQR